MKTEELKNLQASLKEKYRNDPESVIITLSAKGKIGEGISCKIKKYAPNYKFGTDAITFF